jgi:glycerol-3-phosphate dehydrogenase
MSFAAAVRPGPEYDAIVIGAGINGAAIARELALCAQRVLLLDQHDLGSGTSAASTRLIHGGLRYLEFGELSLVRESLHERERLLRSAPHLVEPLGIYLPIYAGGRRPKWQIRAGMWLYDLLSSGKSLPRHRMLGRDAMLRDLPGLDGEGLVGGAFYFDAQVCFPERLTLENVKDAVMHGADLATHTPAILVDVDDGRVRGVAWRDRDGQDGYSSAPIVVNATGPWVDSLLGGISDRPLIGGTKGSHLIVEPFDGAPSAAVYTEAASDGRPFFIVPWNGRYLIGTTDERYAGDPDDALISDHELEYLVAETARLFPGVADLERRVLYTQAGVRPLPFTSGRKTAAITRRHLIRRHRSARGLYSIVGGKLTTHRALAEDFLKRLRQRVPGLPAASPSRDARLPGALRGAERDALLADLSAAFGADQAMRLWRIYGAAARDVLAAAHGSPELARVVGPTSRCLVAELVHGFEREWAATLIDVLQRRCMAGLDADFGLRTAPAAAECLVRLGLMDSGRAEREVADYRRYARRFRVRAA